MPTIFDSVDSKQISAYWTELSQDEAPYMTEELFPVDKKRGLKLDWLKGAKGLPIVLKTSAFDTFAIPRPRIGFAKLEAQMPYFKESKYIDEEMRQELNTALETGNQVYIDAITTRIFDDEVELIRGARASRERMRMMALTTGVITMSNNGQTFSFDYGIPTANKAKAVTSWSNTATADPIEDIRLAKEKIQDATGEELTRAMCSGKTWRYLRNNEKIKKSIYVLSQGIASNISDERLRQFILDEVGIRVVVNDKRYADENGASQKFMPDDTFVMFPDGALGKTWFGTTPQESDLMSGSAANVSIVDTGVSITTAKKVDPVQVETICAMICLPSFEKADSVFILDTNQ